MTSVDELINDVLAKACMHSYDTDDPDAYVAGAEFGARQVLRMIAATLAEFAEPNMPEMSQ